jgi:hypothetical protein
MESHPVINEEDNESSKITEESDSTLVIEESKISSSMDTSVLPTDMTASNFTIQRPKDLFDGKSNLQLTIFFYTRYQEVLERAEEIGRTFASEEKPFEFKYQARALIFELLKNDISKFENSPEIKAKIQKHLSSSPKVEETKSDALSQLAKHDTDLIRLTIAKGLIFYLLGINFFESEEYSDCEKHLKIALEYMNSLPKDVKICF